jgi:hypothetical protein
MVLPLILGALLLLAGACTGERESVPLGEESTAEEAAEPEAWRLSEAPILEIGVREGEEAYQLDRATGSMRLEDGRILILDGGSRQLRFFAPDGTFLMAVGSEGEGPGEFRNPTRLRRTFGDSIQVWDAILSRLSFFDAQGNFLGSTVRPPSTDEPMPLDEWLYGRNWIDSPLPQESREVIRRVVQALPPPDSLGPPRFLKVTRQGRVWASATFPPSTESSTWTVYDLDGRRRATVEIPARLELQEIGSDYLLGRFRDELDINYIRLYRLEKPAGSRPGPGLDPDAMASALPADPWPQDLAPEIVDEIRGLARQALYATASAQEIHYASNYTYTTDLQTLLEERRRGPEIPEGVDVAIILADNRGWIGTVTHRETQFTCGLAYGAYLPMGWPPGSLICP